MTYLPLFVLSQIIRFPFIKMICSAFTVEDICYFFHLSGQFADQPALTALLVNGHRVAGDR